MTGGDAGAMFIEEELRLAEALASLEVAIEKTALSLQRQDDEYVQIKAYMADRRGELEPTEMYQNELLLRDLDVQGAHTMRRHQRLVSMRPSPYFARLDFRPEQAGNKPERHYLGQRAFRDADGVAVLDWRSPLGGLYYEADLGPASYQAPKGEICGAVTRKRQIRVEEGALQFVFDTDQTVRDEILQEELGRTTDAHMRAIVATIQRDQNAIIRNETDRTVVVQGIAGSGKSSIALHRIAYLLFRGRDSLAAENIAIVSPTPLFAAYVSQVLPELGEDAVVALDLVGIARAQLPGALRCEAPADPIDPPDPGAHDRARAKATIRAHEWLVTATEDELAACFRAEDIRLGSWWIGREHLAGRFADLAKFPARERLKIMGRELAEGQGSPSGTTRPPRQSQIARKLGSMLTVKSARALYRLLYKRDDAPAALCSAPGGGLEWGDVYPYLFVQGRFDGWVGDEQIRHLVIDEMQDYSPTQYAVLQQLYRCNSTVLGDVGQSLGSVQRYRLDELRQLFPGATVMELTRSYRSTTEIIDFAGKILGEKITAVERHGDRPKVHVCASAAKETELLLSMMRQFRQANLGRGGRRLALLARSRRACQLLVQRLLPLFPDLAVASADQDLRDDVLGADVTVLALADAKGLEFDEVIVTGAADAEYCRDEDRALLYIACTRALHRLTLTCVGQPSRHLPADATLTEQGR